MFDLPSESGLDVRTCVVRAMILHTVQRSITCPIDGTVLDVDTCVAIVGGPDMDDVLGVVSPSAWVKIGPAFRAKYPTKEIWVGRVQEIVEHGEPS